MARGDGPEAIVTFLTKSPCRIPKNGGSNFLGGVALFRDLLLPASADIRDI